MIGLIPPKRVDTDVPAAEATGVASTRLPSQQSGAELTS